MWHCDYINIMYKARKLDILSPLLFVNLLDNVVKYCHQKSNKFHVGNCRLKPVYLFELALADDIVLLAWYEGDLQNNVSSWAEELSKRNTEVSVEETKTMVIVRCNGG